MANRGYKEFLVEELYTVTKAAESLVKLADRFKRFGFATDTAKDLSKKVQNDLKRLSMMFVKEYKSRVGLKGNVFSRY